MVKKTDCKKISILDMCIDNYTVREFLLRLDTYLGSTILNVIETVTMEQLILAAEHPVIKECLEQADLCIVGESEILSETGNASAQHMKEIREQIFLKESLKRIVRSQKRIFLIAMTSAKLEQIQMFFAECVPEFSAVGTCAVEEYAEDMDSIGNEMNGAAPDIVISALESPMEEEFLQSHKDKIHTCVWYGLGMACHQGQGKIQVGRTIKKLALRSRLHHSMLKYGKMMDKDEK